MKKKITILFLSLLTVAHAFAQIGLGQQVENNDFEQWENTGSTSIEPINWNSLVAQSTNNGLSSFLAGQGRKQVVWQETEILPPNTTGTSCVKLKAFSVLGVVANGNITTGCINLGSTTATDTKNCSYTKHGDASLSEAFTSRPDYVYFWAKTSLSNSSHLARINAVIHNNVVSSGAYNNACYQDPVPSSSSNTNVGTDGAGNEAKVVAKATENFNTSGNWELKQVAFDYDSYVSNNAQAEYVLITLSTNQNAGSGTAGDLLYVDDIVMVYDTRLASLQVNGITVTGFQAPGNSFPEMVDTATVVLSMNWCISLPMPTPTFTCQSQNATAEITHPATEEQPYTIITVTQSGVAKNYRINYEYTSVAPQTITVCESELPYLWSGQELTEAGTYTDSLQNIFGCDSICTLNLSVAPSYDIYVVDTTYTNELYENYGISNIFTDTATTSFEIIGTTAEGCDSVIHLTIVVLNPEGIQDVNLSNRITIYPNPAKDYMTISADGVQMKEVTLFDNAGRKVYQQKINAAQFTFGVQHLSIGEYVMQIVTDNGLLQKKVIIQ